jgi:methionine-rich copper-binding protein CopC
MPAGLAAALAAAAVAALMLAPAALAHARPIATLPADGAVLPTAPDRVTITSMTR